MAKKTLNDTYKEYEKLYNRQSSKFNMTDKLTFGEFQEQYTNLRAEQSKSVSVRDGGNASIIHGKLVNFIVQNQQIGSYEVAAELRRGAIEMASEGGKISKSQMPKITFFTKPDLSKWEGTVVEGVNKKGMKYKYTMSKVNAWFAYMAFIGMRQEAEAEYGY